MAARTASTQRRHMADLTDMPILNHDGRTN